MKPHRTPSRTQLADAAAFTRQMAEDQHALREMVGPNAGQKDRNRFLVMRASRLAKLPAVYCRNKHCGAFLGLTGIYQAPGEEVETWHCSLCQTDTLISRPVDEEGGDAGCADDDDVARHAPEQANGGPRLDAEYMGEEE